MLITANPFPGFSQVSSTFMRTFKAPGMNGGLALETTSDGGFIGTGQHEIDASQSCDLYVYKVNSCGDPEWFKTYGGLLEDGGKSIKQTADGGYIVAGLTKMENGEYDIWLIKMDAAGNITWNKIWGGTGPDYGINVNTTSDGGYIVTGFFTGLGFGGQDVALIKTDALGNIQWSKQYGGAGNDWGDYVTQTSDGGYLVTGYTDSYGAGGADVYMLKTDAAGNLQWTKTYGTPGDDSQPWGNYAANTPDGGYVVCSHTNGSGSGGFDFWAFKTDATGNIQWSNTYGGGGDESSRHVELTHDGGFILCGYTNSWGFGDADAYFVKIDAGGGLQWSKLYGGTGADKGTCARATADGGYSMSLISTSFGADYYDPVFMKTDSAGNVGCNEAVAGTVTLPFTPTVGSGGGESVPVFVTSSPTLSPGSFTPVDNFLCFQCNTKPEFVANDTLVCINQAVDFFNTTTIGLRCHESWEINGVGISGIDTITYSFPAVGLYTVSLLGHCGPQSDTMSASVFVIPDPVAGFTFHNSCQDSAIHFTSQSSSFVVTHITDWSWDFGDGGALSSDTNPVHQYTAPGTYSVSLTVTDNEHCTNTIVKPVTAFPLPQPNFGFSNVCDFNPVNFTDSTTVVTGSIAGYSWNFGDSNSSAQQNPSHQYGAPGQYIVTLTATSDSYCVASVTKNVTIYPVPVAGFTVPNVCLTVPNQFNNTTTISSGTNTYSWDFGDASGSTTPDPTHTYATPATYNVVLVATSNNNCVDSVSNTVTIYPNPVPDFSYTDTCQGMTIGFSDLATVANGSISAWDWTFGDNTASTSQNPNHVFTQAGTFTVQLKVTTNNTCTDSVTHSVTAYPLPVSDFTFTSVCYQQQTDFTNSSAVATGSIVQSDWNFGDGSGVSNLPSPSYTYATPGTYTVVLSSQTNLGCRGTVQHSVDVYSLPVANFTATTPCIGTPVQFTDSTSPANGANTFDWLFGDGGNSAIQSPSHLYTAAGTYNAQLISTTGNACADTIIKTVTVLGKSTAQFTGTDVCLNDTTIFTNGTDTSVYPVSNFWWALGDGIGTGNAINPVYPYGTSGTFTVTMVADYSNGCADTTTQLVTVYLLPTINSSVTNVSCFGGSDAQIQLTPVAGQAPFTYTWSNTATIALNSALSIGTYDVTVTDAHQCTASATFSITEPTKLVVDTVVSPIVCYGYDNGSIELITTGGTPPYGFVWNHGSTVANGANLAPGAYAVTVSDALGCTVLQSFIMLQPLPYLVVMDTAVTINLGESIQLNPTTANGTAVTWEWTPANYLSCTNCQSPVAGPLATYHYLVQSTSDLGCEAQRHVQVTVIPDYNIYIPNAFTPNGDGQNDYFEVFGHKQAWKQFSLQVFDRLGEKVFETSDMNFKWDGSYKGKPLNGTVLIYTAHLVYMDNHTDKMFKGSITLLR